MARPKTSRDHTPHLAMFGDVRSVHLRRIANHFAGHGYRVTVISDSEPPDPATHRTAFDFCPWQWPERASWLVNRFWLHRSRAWLRRLLARIGADLLHVHYLNYAAVGAAAGVRDIPVVFTAWGSDINTDPERLRRFPARSRFRRYLRSADLFTADAQDLFDRYIELAARPVRGALVRFGADLDVFRPGEPSAELRDELGLPPQARVVLFVRGFRPDYKALTFVRSAPEVVRCVPDAHFVIKAPPLYTESDRRHADDARLLIDRLGLRERFVLDVRYVPHERIADYLRLADVLVNVPERDGLAEELIEAMACGLPVVGPNHPAYDGFFEPEQTGLEAAHDDPAAVAAQVVRLLRDPELAARMACRCRAVAEQHGDWHAEMRKMAALYDDLLAQDRAVRSRT